MGCVICAQEFKILSFDILLFIIIYLCLVKATYNKSVERDYEMAARGRKQKACLLQ
jgi:hypothetical protein